MTLSTWRHLTQDTAKQRSLRQEALAGVRQLHAAAVISVWMEKSCYYKTRQQTINSFTFRIAQCVKGHVVVAWKEYTTYRQSCQAKMHQLQDRMSLHLLSSVFVGWRETVGIRKERQRKLGIALKRTQHASLSHAFVSWRSWAEEASRLTTFFARRHQNLMKEMLLHWRSWSHYDRDLKNRCTWFLRQTQLRDLSSVLSSWYFYVLYRQNLQSVLSDAYSKREHCMMETTFWAWQRHTEEARARAQKVEQCLTARGHHQLASSLHFWILFAGYRQELRSKELSILEGSQRRRQSAFFVSWREYTEYVRWIRPRLSSFSMILQRKYIHRVFASWQSFVICQSGARCILFHIRSRTVMDSFRSWLEITQWNRDLRAKLSICMENLRKRTLCVDFGHWKAYASQRIVQNCRKRSADEHYVQTTMHKVLREWLTRCRTEKRVLAFWPRRTTAKVLSISYRADIPTHLSLLFRSSQTGNCTAYIARDVDS